MIEDSMQACRCTSLTGEHDGCTNAACDGTAVYGTVLVDVTAEAFINLCLPCIVENWDESIEVLERKTLSADDPNRPVCGSGTANTSINGKAQDPLVVETGYACGSLADIQFKLTGIL